MKKYVDIPKHNTALFFIYPMNILPQQFIYSLFTVLSLTILDEFAFSQAIDGGYDHSLVFCDDGTVAACGRNIFGQLGIGAAFPGNTSFPKQVVGLNNIIMVAAGSFHSLALDSDSTVWSWGLNNYGQLGLGTYTTAYLPTPMLGITDIISIGGGYYHSLALQSDSTVWAWGFNQFGQLGDSTQIDKTAPVPVYGLSKFIAIAAGSFHSMALCSDSTVWAWGYNGFGQLGNNTTTSKMYPVQVVGLSNVIAIAAGVEHSIALSNDGTLWTWGRNLYGQLGDSTNVNRTIPIPVLSNVIGIAGGGLHTIALRNDGTVWTWGRNDKGQLGDGTFTDSNAPTQMLSISNIVHVAGGLKHSFAIKKNGTVWAWGFGGYGQLGDAMGNTSPDPVAMMLSCNAFPLPIEMIQFTGYHKNGVNTLQWVTSVEIENDHFVVERSSHGVVFESIGQVKGVSNASSQHQYTFTDNTPVNGANYYRLKQVDWDGHNIYSEVITIVAEFADDFFINISPNPAHSTVKVKFQIHTETDPVGIQIYNAFGQQVSASMLDNLSIGTHQKEWNTVHWSAGIYFISVNTATDYYIKKLVISK